MIRQPCDCAQSCTTSVICEDALPAVKPIRVIQFLLVATAFALTVYTISRNTPYERTEEILLTTLYTSFLFIAVVDMISQFSGDPISDTPMFLFGVVGTVLFLLAAFGLFFVMNRAGIVQMWRLTTNMALSSLVVLLLFVLTIYMIVMDPIPMSVLACIFLIVLSGVYVFVLAVELISQFAGGALYIIPMFVFSLLGILFFGAAGILLIVSTYTELIVHIAAVILCLLAALIFLIDVTMIIVFWKRICSICKQCCNNGEIEFLLHKDKKLHLDHVKIMKQDITTSVSDVRLPPAPQDTATPDHCYRKIEHPRRRQYVDCPTCVPSFCNINVAEIQTEPKTVLMEESQTPDTVMKETPMQTSSKCEFCQRQMQPFVPLITEGTDLSCFQYPGPWTCPAIVQFVRGGISVPCCPGCKCATTQTQHQPQQLTTERRRWLSQTVNPSACATLTSETTQQVASSANASDKDITRKVTGVAETVTKLTLASFYVKPNRKIQLNHENITSNQKITEIKDAKQTTEEIMVQGVEQDLVTEIITTVVKNEKSKAMDETIADSTQKKERTSTILKEKTAALQKDNRAVDRKLLVGKEGKNIEKRGEEPADESDNVQRNKGGGEEEIRIWQQFERVAEGSTAKINESSRCAVATQISATLITSPTSRTKPKMFLHLKSNKVDPIDNANRLNERRIGEIIENQMTRLNQARGNKSSESKSIERQTKDICSFCRQQKSLIPTSDNTRYHAIYKDKRGRYFCEFCVPLGCKRVIGEIEDIDIKKLRCAKCGFSFRERRVNINACPRCGQPQRYIAPSSSM